jgi:hypothetical protein
MSFVDFVDSVIPLKQTQCSERMVCKYSLSRYTNQTTGTEQNTVDCDEHSSISLSGNFGLQRITPTAK